MPSIESIDLNSLIKIRDETLSNELQRSQLEAEELPHLDGQGEGNVRWASARAGNGEVGPAAEIRPQRLHVRAQVAGVQALACQHRPTVILR